MKISNQYAWDTWVQNNRDFYGKGILDYAERWADLMESLMDAGNALEDIAEKASHDVDTDGITGFMYGASVSVLSSCWEHGEQLRQWHNLDTQIGNEGEVANKSGGVLNPALLNISLPK